MNLKHDKEWLESNTLGVAHPSQEFNSYPQALAAEYHEHMQKFYPADEWHEELGDVLWYKLPVAESPYVGSPLDFGWDDEPFAILLNGETRAEYFTHFQHIHTPEH